MTLLLLVLVACCLFLFGTDGLVARYLPDWLPFMERLRYANTWRWAIQNITNIPFAEAMQKMV
jgi:hypothetical protein